MAPEKTDSVQGTDSFQGLLQFLLHISRPQIHARLPQVAWSHNDTMAVKTMHASHFPAPKLCCQFQPHFECLPGCNSHSVSFPLRLFKNPYKWWFVNLLCRKVQVQNLAHQQYQPFDTCVCNTYFFHHCLQSLKTVLVWKNQVPSRSGRPPSQDTGAHIAFAIPLSVNQPALSRRFPKTLWPLVNGQRRSNLTMSQKTIPTP